MTGSRVTDSRELGLAWLHCNECHRSFEHHNRLVEEAEGILKIVRSDLVFAFSSCGHFFCETCVQNHTVGGKYICTLCQMEASTYRIDHQVPKSLQMYLKAPINHFEDSISVMNFQISNANMLIKSLRSKVAQQKELMSKAKQELASHKILKGKLNELQQENERLRRRLDDVSRAAGNATPAAASVPKITTPAATPGIHIQGRLTLRSPVANIQSQNNNGDVFTKPSVPSQVSGGNWQKSPAIQSFYDRDERRPRHWSTTSSSQPILSLHTNLPPVPPDSTRMAEPIYATPDNRPRCYPYEPLANNNSIYGQVSPRPVYRSNYNNHHHHHHHHNYSQRNRDLKSPF